MFDEGQKLPSAYHRTKFESEKIAREQSRVPWRVYRPAVVVGHSQTGEMDKIDGPYYFFKAIQKIRGTGCPSGSPLDRPGAGLHQHRARSTTSPRAMDHIAHQPGLDGQAFHLAHPKGQRSGDVLNAFARAGHAPHMAMRIDKSLLDALPKGTLSMRHEAAGAQGRARLDPRRLRHPDRGRRARRASPRSSTRATPSGRWPAPTSRCPSSTTYAASCGTTGSATSTPTCTRTARSSTRSTARRWSSPAPRRASACRPRTRSPRAGGIPILVARSMDKLEEVEADIERTGGTAYAYSADLSDMDSIDDARRRGCWPTTRRSTCWSTTPGARSGARSRSAYDRFHDFERTIQLNYLGTIKLIMGLLPHMRERSSGHIVNVSSIGVQTNPPRFSAYVASKAALDAWTRVVSLRGDRRRRSRSRRSTCRSCARR